MPLLLVKLEKSFFGIVLDASDSNNGRCLRLMCKKRL
jgi:hypothetical protein